MGNHSWYRGTVCRKDTRGAALGAERECLLGTGAETLELFQMVCLPSSTHILLREQS